MNELSRRTCLRLAAYSGSVAFPASLALAQTSTAQSDIDLVRSRVAAYLNKVVALSRASPPPGLNASNGWFVNAMKGDPQLALAGRNIETDSPGGQAMAGVANSFMTACRAGFGPGLHGATGLTYLPLAIQVLDAAKGSIIKLAGDVLAVAYGGPGVAKAAMPRIRADLDRVSDEVKSKGVVTNGEHANGWISVEMRNQAAAAAQRAADAKAGLPARSRDVLEIIRVTCTSIAALPTDKHDPWLRADWQLGFQTVCEAGVEALGTA